MKSLLRTVITAGVFLCAVHSQAATLSPEHTLTVPIDGGWVGSGGTVGQDGFDDWLLDVRPDGQDAQVTSIAVEFSRHQGSVNLFNREESSNDPNGWASLSGTVYTDGVGRLQTAVLTFLALDAFDYALRITGTAGFIGTPYTLGVAAISPVPLPASAWLFFSVLLASGWLVQRRGNPGISSRQVPAAA